MASKVIICQDNQSVGSKALAVSSPQGCTLLSGWRRHSSTPRTVSVAYLLVDRSSLAEGHLPIVVAMIQSVRASSIDNPLCICFLKGVCLRPVAKSSVPSRDLALVL